MKKTTIASLIGLAFSTQISAQTGSIYANDIVVTATRLVENRDNVIGDISVITSQDIQRAGQSSLTELLQSQPGVEIETNGGAGSLSNVRLRGTNAQSVVVLIDGMRISSAANSLTNFGQVQLNQIDRIEILKGAASSLYGSDAIGGVIQIFTKQGKEGVQISANAGYGSFNTQQISTGINGKINDTKFSLGIASNSSDGISTYKTKNGQDADKDSFNNLGLSANISQKINENHELGFQTFLNDGHLNLDGDNFPAHQNNQQRIFAINSKNKLTSFWLSQLKIGESTDVANAVGSYGSNNTKSMQRQLYWQNELTLPLGRLLLAYDRIEDKVKSTTAYSLDHRTNDGFIAGYQLNYQAHAANFSFRHDNNSQFGGHNTGSVNYGLKFADFWRVSAAYGTAFRAPTFNDLYWPFQDYGIYGTYEGNPSLKPETSRNKELSLTYDQGHHRLSATVFENKISNLIIGSQGLFNDSPINLGKASITGLTLSYEGWLSNYHIRANADFQDPKNEDGDEKILPRRAKKHGSAWIGKSWNTFEVGTELIANGRRFNDADNTIPLGGYTLVNLTAKYKIDNDWSLNGRINNLFDRDYALATTASSWDRSLPAYNTPGLNLFIGISYSPSY
jgi:vitamin B12 transporter